MATSTWTCPKCGGSLTPANGDANRRTCAACGAGFNVRSKAAAGSAKPAKAFTDPDSLPEPRPKTASASTAKSLPSGRMDPRVLLALVGGGLLAFLFLAVVGVVVLTVVLWPRIAVKPPAVAVLPISAPTPPVTDHPSDPAPPPKPAPAGDNPTTPPKKPVPPMEAPPVHDAPLPLPPTADPAPPAPDPKPAADPNPMPAPMPAPSPPVDPIDQAVDKGVAFLKKEALNNGARPAAGGLAGFGFGQQAGQMGLIGLALLESSVPADDPAVAACTNVVRADEPTCSNTYEMAISIWFLDRLGDPRDEDLIHDLGARLVAGQMENGLWTYTCPTGTGAAANPLGPAPGLAALGLGLGVGDLTADQLKELMETLTKYDPSKEIPAKKQLAPVCRYVRGKKLAQGVPGQPGALTFGMGDLSLTQFATLGLWVARKHHVPVDRSVLMTEAHVRAAQAADGGWSYNGMVLGPGVVGGGFLGTTDSMTCSGMMELAVARGVTQPPNGKTEAADPQFEKGLIYLADLFDRGNPPGRQPAPANAAQTQNLAAAVGRLGFLQAQVTSPFVENQPAVWKKSLKAFQGELERDLALDLPADARKDLQAVDDEIKKYDGAPSAKERKALVELIQKTGALQGNGLALFGLNGGPGRFLKPGKANRNNLDDIYCLWSLERLCMVCDLKTVAGRDWYAWGANLLVADQNDDGSWPDAGICGPEVDTCLAVLFLKRVNVAKDLTTQLRTIAPIKDLAGDKLKLVAPHGMPSPGETTPSPGETLSAPPGPPKP